MQWFRYYFARVAHDFDICSQVLHPFRWMYGYIYACKYIYIYHNSSSLDWMGLDWVGVVKVARLAWIGLGWVAFLREGGIHSGRAGFDWVGDGLASVRVSWVGSDWVERFWIGGLECPGRFGIRNTAFGSQVGQWWRHYGIQTPINYNIGRIT